VLQAAANYRTSAYVVLSLTTGIRTEEARALRWDHVDLEAGTVAVWRSVRSHGDVKTEKSRRTLGLPQATVEALREHLERQADDRLKAGSYGATIVSSSPPASAGLSTRATSGGRSGPSARPLESARTGHPASCGRRLCR